MQHAIRVWLLSAALAGSAAAQDTTKRLVAVPGTGIVVERELTPTEVLRETKISLSERSIRFDDLVQLLADRTGLFFDLHEDEGPEGFDATVRLSIVVNEASAYDVLRFAVKRASRRMREDVGWQEGLLGSIEVGFKSELNEASESRVYAVGDLLFEIPNYWIAPFAMGGAGQLQTRDTVEGPRSLVTYSLTERIRTERVLMRRMKERGLRDPYREEYAGNPDNENQRIHQQILVPTHDHYEVARRARAEELIDTIKSNVEPDQWSHPRLRIEYKDDAKALVITAPPYIHRQIGGGLGVSD
ncbi:MAG: hypothetical protein AAF108_03560 [Planctomycetota bacterium]